MDKKVLIGVLIIASSYLVVGLSSGILPYITRKNIVFGVTLPENYLSDDFIKQLKKKFLIYNLIFSILIPIPLFFLAMGKSPDLHDAPAFFVYLIVSFIIQLIVVYALYINFHKQVKSFKKEKLTVEEQAIPQILVIDTDFSKQKLTVSNWLLVVISILMTLLTLLIGIWLYPEMPEKVPVHWSGNGIANGFSDKSIGLILAMPLIQILLSIVLIVANLALKNAKQKLDIKNPEVSAIQNYKFRLVNSRFLTLVIVAIDILFAMIQYYMLKGVPNINQTLFLPYTIVFIIFTIGGAIYIMVRYEQGGSRYHVKNQPKAEKNLENVKTYDDDDAWKWGFIYYNPNDPSLWVEQRLGIGITLNFGNRKAWYYIGGLVVIVVGIVVFSFLFA